MSQVVVAESEGEMPFAAAVSEQSSTSGALDEVIEKVSAELNGPPDLSVLFVSRHYSASFPALAATIRRKFGTRVLLGCTGETVICGEREYESSPAIALWSAILPGTELVPFQLEFAETPDGFLCDGLPELVPSGDTRAVFLLSEPFSSVPQSVLDRLADELPDVPVIGGMASGGHPGQNRLFLNDREITEGSVGVILRGGPPVRTVVSQGCRPIGTPFVVTRAENDVVYELGGMAPLQRLQEMYQNLPARDQELVENGVHIGIALNAYQDTFHRGDFLILNVIGIDRKTGALKAGGPVRAGQTVQFQIRDGETADADLKRLLERYRSEHPSRASGGLLFSCNGRGTRMFSDRDHDAALVQQLLGPMPLAGFFAQGELGPVGGKNYIHGFTACLALFEDPAT